MDIKNHIDSYFVPIYPCWAESATWHLYGSTFSNSLILMKTTISQRKSADTTRSKIIKTARKLFAKKGFAGTSISEIANKASINQSLIYHHFKNKAELWRRVKHDVLIQYFNINNINAWAHESKVPFKEFLKTLITQRFELYNNHPELRRMIAWQRLEPVSQELNIAGNWRKQLETIIASYQKKGEVRKDYKPALILIMILTMSTSLFLDPHATLKSASKTDAEKIKQEYLELITQTLLQALV